VNPELTPRISVRGRTYFTEPSYRKAQHLWSFRREEELKDASSPRFFVQSTRSWTTADLSTDLSISLSHKKNLRNKEKTCEGYVAEISAPPLAVERPLLAAGYDFAVIAGDGQVLYHSDPRRTLKENFFAEVDNPDDVHAAIQSRAGRHLKTLYARRPSELFIRPLDLNNAGWFVVTLRDRGWIYAVATETLVYAMAWCCLSWLASTLVLLMVFLRSGKERLHYWWPTPQKGKFYQTLTGIYAFLLIGGLAVVVRADPVGSGLFRFSLAFPLIAAVTTVMMHWRSSYDRAPQGDLHRTSYWTWYVAALAAMWAAAGIVPAAGLFRHSWHLEMHKLDQYERTRYRRSMDDWDAEDREYYRKREISFATPWERDELLEHRKEDRVSFIVGYAQGGFSVSALEDWLDRHLPFYSESVESVRYQRAGDGSAIYPFPVDTDQSASGSVSLPSLLLFGLFAIVAASCFRFTVRSLFWPRLLRKFARPAVERAERPYAVLLVPTSQQKRALKELFQPAAVALAAETGGQTQFVHARDGGLEVFDFEDTWCDARGRQGMLERLEIGQNGARTLILAKSDPLFLLTQEASKDEQISPSNLSEAERQRWLRVFRPFHKIQSPVFRDDGSDCAHLETVWRGCSPVEQLTLIQVAQEGFANRNQSATVRGLLDRGLLELNPHLKLAVPEWREFVLEQMSSTQVERLEQPEGKPGWRSVRWIFLSLLAIALLFAFVTGASWIKSATAMMTILGGIMETLWKVVSAFHRIGAKQGE